MIDLPDPLTPVWTGDMADVAEQCGDDVAAELAARVPGIMIHVPAAMSEKSVLQLIEPAIAERLIDRFAGDTLYISRRRPRSRKAAVKALYEAGVSPRQIALQLGISQRRVQQLKKSAGAGAGEASRT